MDAVRAADRDRGSVLEGAARDRSERCVESPEDERAGLTHLERERRVEHVRRREPVVEPAAGLADLLGDRIDERGDVVVSDALDLGDPLGRWRLRPLAQLGGGLERDDPELGPRLRRGQLDLEQPR